MSDEQPTTPSVIAVGSSTAEQAAAFADDPRIHFDRAAGTWRFENDDGGELEYDASKAAWVPVVDEDLVKAQQAAYSVAGVDEETPAAPVLKRTKKRKEPEDYTSSTVGASAGPATKKGKKGTTNGQPEKMPKNTAVYVTGLPPDTQSEELAERFKKFGVIEEDDDGSPKIKLYARDDGSFSGDALVVYFKEESVDLAVTMLDDDELRIGDPSTRMRVQRAEFGHKHESQGGADGKAKPRKTVTDKKKATRRIVKMQKKLGEWDDEDGFGPSITEDKAPLIDKSRVVVLKHMFTLQELEEDTSLLLDLKEDVREECSSLGEVTNVVLYDKEPEGVMTVKFRDPLSAQACVIKMNGRFFAGRRIEASLFTGKQRFKRSTDNPLEEGGEGGEKQRLDDFANWLMTEGD